MQQLSLFNKPPSPEPARELVLTNTRAVIEAEYLPQSLRPYQAEAMAAIAESFSRGFKRPLVVMATGGGKTTVIAQYLLDHINPRTQRALVIAHTEEIIFQLRDRIANQFGGALDNLYGGASGIGVVMGAFDNPDARIVVATRQSLHKRRLPTLLESGMFDLVIIDEAHHAIQKNTYGTIADVLAESNPELRFLGFTATPKRSDEIALGTFWDDIAFTWGIEDGIEQGYLSPPLRIEVATRANVSGVRTSRGDYSQAKLVSALKLANWLELTVAAYKEHILDKGRPTLAFMPSVEMSHDFVFELVGLGVRARHIDGTTSKKDRRYILREYLSGHVEVVSNFGVLTEGFDAPHTQAIFMARPTRSPTLFTQIIGRGLRRYPGKDNCLIVDLTVVDTRALRMGTLLGKVVRCHYCRAEYFYSLPACPFCGAVVPIVGEGGPGGGGSGENELEDFVGVGLVSQTKAIFEGSFSAWYVANGYSTCGLGDQGTLAIVPPIKDDYYRLVRIPKSSDEKIVVLQRDSDIASLIFAADSLVKKTSAGLAAREAEWRNNPPGEGQIKWIKKTGGHPNLAILSKGEASQILTHRFALKRVKGLMG